MFRLPWYTPFIGHPKYHPRGGFPVNRWPEARRSTRRGPNRNVIDPSRPRVKKALRIADANVRRIDRLERKGQFGSMPYTTFGGKQYGRSRRRICPTYRRGRYRTGGAMRYQKGNSLQKERKVLDTTLSASNVSATGVIVSNSLLLMAEGTGENQRIGRHITVVSLDVHMRLILEPTAATGFNSADVLRVIFYVDSQANGAAAAIGEILSTADVNSHRNLFQTNRFRVIYDKWFTMNTTSAGEANGDTTSQNVMRHANFHRNLNMRVDYETAGASITDVCCQNIGVLAISAAALTDLTGQVRIRYTG